MLSLQNRVPLNLREEALNPLTGAFCDFPLMMRCSNCLMDTSDPTISFDDQSLCSFCIASKTWDFVKVNSEANNIKIESMVDSIKKNNSKSEFDCLIGISGGVDSSYLALLAVDWGLKPLFVHVDAGWNTNVANQNINNLLDSINQELYTVVVDWNSVRESQIAFLKSGVANQDVPQDYLFTRHILNVARKFGVKSILSGSNMATESILPKEWGYDAQDPVHIKSIHKAFLSDNQDRIEVDGLIKSRLIRTFGKIEVHRPLNLVPYSRNNALKTLENYCDWQNYGPKHFESRWTRYFQGYFLPLRFGYDKRKPHLSSRILSGELTKAQAEIEMSNSNYDIETLSEDEIFICNKLNLTHAAFLEFKNLPLGHFSDYPNVERITTRLRQIRNYLK